MVMCVHFCLTCDRQPTPPYQPLTQVPEGEREGADLWLLNSCTVKNPSEAGAVNLVEKARSASGGC